MREKIIELMNEKGYTAKTLKELSEVLDVNEIELQRELQKLESDYVIRQSKKKKYDLLKRFNLHVGIIEVKEKGFGFIRSDEFLDEFYVPKDFIKDSMNKDKVIFCITDQVGDAGYKKEAAVVEVVERNLIQVVGKIHAGKNGKKLFVADDKKLDFKFEVQDFGISVIGDVVVFEIAEYVNAKLVRGNIKKTIGNINDVGIDIKSIAYKYGFNSEFPEEVMQEIKNNDFDYEAEVARRRRVPGKVITIDGEDAKDLDDAVSVRMLDNGNYLLGVYIADVSFYVRENSELDKESLNRGTSVYLADRVIPMLPHKLSNDLCSLNAHEDKLVMCCEMEINPAGHVVNHDIYEGVLRTVHRMTYTNVNLMLEEADQRVISEYQDIYSELVLMNNLAQILRDMRFRRGSLDFDIPESKIIIDDFGKPIDIVLRTRGVGEKLIEEFMLRANETVAETITNLGLPFIYRVHDEPNDLKLSKFSKVAKVLGYKVNIRKTKVSPRELQKVLADISDEDDGLRTLLLRMMAKAKYSEKNIGHYGLASTCYTHFTSPIRRYPDLIVHRLLRKYLINHEVSSIDQDQSLAMIINAAEQSSKKERDAIECEYEVSDMKKAEYMEQFIGEKYKAKITTVTNFGMFAALDNTIEGLIHVSDMDGYFVYNEDKMALVSNRKSYRLGDVIEVRVKKASKESKQIDFEVVRSENDGKGYKGRRKKQKGKS